MLPRFFPWLDLALLALVGLDALGYYLMGGKRRLYDHPADAVLLTKCPGVAPTHGPHDHSSPCGVPSHVSMANWNDVPDYSFDGFGRAHWRYNEPTGTFAPVNRPWFHTAEFWMSESGQVPGNMSIGPAIMPVPQPWPEPIVVPNPFRGPLASPAPAPSPMQAPVTQMTMEISPNGNVRARTRTMPRRAQLRRRPGKERKSQAQRAYGFVVRVWDGAGEVIDTLECLNKALPVPWQAQKKRGSKGHDRTAGAGTPYGKEPGGSWLGLPEGEMVKNPAWKMADSVYHGFHLIDWSKFAQCQAYETFVEDKIVGRANRAAQVPRNTSGRGWNINFNVGPAL